MRDEKQIDQDLADLDRCLVAPRGSPGGRVSVTRRAAIPLPATYPPLPGARGQRGDSGDR